MKIQRVRRKKKKEFKMVPLVMPFRLMRLLPRHPLSTQDSSNAEELPR